MMAGRRLRTVVAVVLVIGLASAGLWRRSQLAADARSAREARARLRSTLAITERHIADSLVLIARADRENESLRTEADGLRRVADELAARIQAVQRQRDDAAIVAWVSGGQITVLRTCLDGVNRALNQVSVGDARATASLEAVRKECEAVGA